MPVSGRLSKKALGYLGAAALVAALLIPTGTVQAQAPSRPTLPAHAEAAAPANTPTLKTWTHPNAVATSEPIASDQVRRSTFYDVSVTPARGRPTAYPSFVYMSVPRSGNGKIGYSEQDGAEFAADAGYTMSWSSFEYAEDVWVNVRLTTGQTITSARQVTVRPTDLGLKTRLIDGSTIAVKVPYRRDGFRFSVEFDPQQVTAYNDLSGGSGALTTKKAGNRAISTEPRNAMLVFANPKPTARQARETIPTSRSGTIYRPEQGLVNNLNTVKADILYFEPGTYYMGSDYHAVLPARVKWIYLAPGAYVKGAFRFLHDTQSSYKVTGLGVLSGEQYVYEPDTANGYRHSENDQCWATCVKMLQFESSNTGQSLTVQGITINEPPYHSFVTYAHDASGAEIGVENFRMDVANYKQVGSWYWQTDGIELYDDSQMKNTFFHSNDDVLKLYHSNVHVKNTVIWKNENGPVIQWGWVPRTIDNVTVGNTDIIHNRMYWKDVKYNTCVFNSSSNIADMGATDLADPSTTVKNMTFTDTRVEGAVNCAIRIFALSNTENITINGLAVDGWNGLDPQSQASTLRLYTDGAGTKVRLGNEVRQGNGLRLHNYTVGGIPIAKAGNNWASDELGRLDFDADTWNGWNATYTGQPTGRAPKLTINGPEDGAIIKARDAGASFSGRTDAARLTVRVNGVDKGIRVRHGRFSAHVALSAITNKIVFTAIGRNKVMTVDRRTITSYGNLMGATTDPVGDDDGPGSYTYPTDGAFNAGSFDLTGMQVYRDGELVRFVVSTAGAINNPWGGNGMSTQRLNIYLSDGLSSTPTPLLPGTNTSAAGAWNYAVVADGRYDDARYSSGVYAADHDKISGLTLDVDPKGTIIASVPASAFDGIDLSSAGYQVSLFSDAEDGEGIGGVRPVYSAECASSITCPDFIGQYRAGGGAGDWTDTLESRDTDTRDSNALDIITGAAAQSEVMDWTTGPVVAPYVHLER